MLAALRQQIADLLEAPPARAGVLATGIPALDAVLSGGGLPAGRLTEVVGVRGSGKTTMVREVVAGAIAARRWVAYVDASRTLSPRDWAAIGASGLLWVVRPHHAERGAWCADVLLRSGAFGLVVLDGAPALSREVGIRLTRLARESDAVFLLVQDLEERPRGQIAGSAVRLQVTERQGRGRAEESSATTRLVTVTVEKGGASQSRSVEVSCVIDVARRLCAHSEVPDRRGVATRNRRGERAGPDVPGAKRPAGAGVGGAHTAGESAAQDLHTEPGGDGGGGGGGAPSARGSTLARKRRCAEPVVRRDAFLLADAGGGGGGTRRGGARALPALGRATPGPG
ncbi:MAG: ATPase domain-containing protein [Gemmatimonadaceae bacterium]